MAIALLDLRVASRGGQGDLAAASPSLARPRGIRVAHLLQAALLLLLVANLGRIPVLDSGKKEAPILFNDLVVVALIGAGMLTALRRRRLVLDRPAATALAFAAFGALSTVLAIPRFGLSGFQFVFSIAYLVRWLAYFAFYVVAINVLRGDDVPAVWRTVERAILIFAGFGIVQSIFLPGFAQMVYPDAALFTEWDPQGHRLVSTFLDPNYAGMFILMGLLVLLARLSAGAPVARWKLLLLFTALAMTVSRSSLLAFVTGAVVLVWGVGLSRRALRFGGLLLLLLLPALPVLVQFAATYGKFSIDVSALSRVVSWLRAIRIFADNPGLGVGFNTFGFVQERYGFSEIGNSSFGLDGSLLFIAVMTGVPGLVLYLGMLGGFFRRSVRVWRSPDLGVEERSLGLGVAAVTAALVVHSMFLNSLLYPFLMEMMWVLWALTFLLSRKREAPEAASSAMSLWALPERQRAVP